MTSGHGQGDSFKLPARDEDAVTYLPIQRGKPPATFGPTDLRGASNTGGIRLGQSFKHVVAEAMPRLEVEHVSRACDNVLRSVEVYSSLLYLSRAQPADIPVLMEASQSFEIKVRWERLWVLSVYLGRLSRQNEAHKLLIDAFEEDLAGLHLISKFVDQNNPSVKRLFSRLHDPLLKMLIAKLVDAKEDVRKSALLCGILASIETDERILRKAFDSKLPQASVDTWMGHLYTVAPKDKPKTLRASLLREKLRSWRPE